MARKPNSLTGNTLRLNSTTTSAGTDTALWNANTSDNTTATDYAGIRNTGWNDVRIDRVGRTMKVYVNNLLILDGNNGIANEAIRGTMSNYGLSKATVSYSNDRLLPRYEFSLRDSSAAAIAASGLLELGTLSETPAKRLKYRRAAEDILTGLITYDTALAQSGRSAAKPTSLPSFSTPKWIISCGRVRPGKRTGAADGFVAWSQRGDAPVAFNAVHACPLILGMARGKGPD